MNLTNVQLGSNTAPGAPFTMNRFIDGGAFKLVLNGTGTNIFELTTGAAGATRRFAFASSGQYTMDAYGVGTFTGTAAKWLAVTAAGLVIEEAPPTASITADNGLTMSTATNVQWRGTLNQATTINTAGFNITFTGANAVQSLLTVTNTSAASGAYAIGASSAANAPTISAVNSSGGGILGSALAGGTGVNGTSVTGLGGSFTVNPSSTATVVNIIEITRLSSGSAANGIGGRIQFTVENSGGGTRLAAALDAVWTEITDATRNSKFIINTVTDGDTHAVWSCAGPQSTLTSRDAATNETSERYSVAGAYKALTESAATAFVRINLPSGTVTGGEILITVQANDATDFQSRTLRFIWSAVNKAGTITSNVQTPEESVSVSSGTLDVTIDTNDAGSGNLDFRANAVSSLTQTTLRCSYHVFKNIGTGVITPQ